MTLRTKINWLFGLQILLLLAIILSILFLYSGFDSSNKLDSSKLYLTQTYEYLEKFSDQKDITHIKNFDEAINKIGINLSDDFMNNYQILDLIDDYQKNFKNYTDLYIERGLDENSGQEGIFRNVIHQVQEIVENSEFSDIKADILEIRGREKDFILREDPKYISMVEKDCNSVILKIKKSNFSIKNKQELITKIEFYKVNFKKLTSNIIQLGLLKKNILDNYNNLKLKFDQRISKAAIGIKDLTMITFTVFFIAVFLFLYFTLKISRNIINPIISLRDQISNISIKDLNKRVVTNQSDEIGDLETSFNNMISHMENAYRNIEESNKSLESRVKKRTKELTNQINEKNIFQEKLENAFNNMAKMKVDLKNALVKEKELNNLKTDFVSMVSHEYRTPLTVILTSSYLLEEAFKMGNLELFERNMTLIKESIDRMRDLIEQTTMYNKIETGNIEIVKNSFDLIELINNSIEKFNLIKKENQRLTLISNEKEFLIKNDVRLLRHSIENLISNAIKYSPDFKDIRIEVVKEGSQAVIKVVDDGIGIPEKDKDNLFKPFHRSSNVNGTPGTGLGLSITKQFVESIGGQINYLSSEVEGSTFEIRLRA